MFRPRNDRAFLKRAMAVMSKFQVAFPEIEYDIAWSVNLLNGAAWRERTKLHVRLYGGLLRHKLIGLEACAVLFAHETGHHYGGAPKDNDYKWMSCECQADSWAARDGVRRAMGDVDWRRIVKEGADQILAFEESIAEPEMAFADRGEPDDCLDHASPRDRHQLFMTSVNDKGDR